MLSRGASVQHQDLGAARVYEPVERTGAEYEEMDILQRQSDQRSQSGPQNGDHMLT